MLNFYIYLMSFLCTSIIFCSHEHLTNQETEEILQDIDEKLAQKFDDMLSLMSDMKDTFSLCINEHVHMLTQAGEDTQEIIQEELTNSFSIVRNLKQDILHDHIDFDHTNSAVKSLEDSCHRNFMRTESDFNDIKESMAACCDLLEDHLHEFKPYVMLSLTSGFVFKHDTIFNQTYGLGMVNLITADVCYLPIESLGIGAKIAFWQNNGKTLQTHRVTQLQEIPFIGYLRLFFGHRVQGFLSLGGGSIFVAEKSYLGRLHTNVAIGNAELGFNYYPHRCVFLTGVAGYLFPKQLFANREIDFGGFELRAGIGVNF